MLSVIHPPSDEAVLRTAPETPGCASHAKRWVLGATILGSSVVFIEGSVINVALPEIQQGLATTVGEMQWIGSVFTLLLATSTLVAGAAGDRLGRRRLFVAGLGVLTLGSLAAGFAATSLQLIAARAVQGLGGALLVPNSLSLLSAGFPRSERGRAIGTWSAFTALTGAVGPIVGGVLVDRLSWRAAFLLVVPLALLTMAVALLRVPDVRIGRRSPAIDVPGALLATLGLTSLVFGIIRLPQTIGLASLAAGLLLLGVFVAVEQRTANPMMPPHLFRSRTFLGANLLTLMVYFALTGAFFVLPFYLVRACGFSATATGAAYLPFALIVAVLSRWSGGLADRYGARLPLVCGPLVSAAGFLLMARAGDGSFWTTVFPAMSTLGVGMAMTVAPLTSSVLAAVDESEAGAASGVNNTVARVAALLAVAIVGLVALRVFDAELALRLTRLELSPPVRAALLAQEHQLGDVPAPAMATPAERAALASAVGDALTASFRWTALLAAACAAAGGLVAGLLVGPVTAQAASEDVGVVPCGHLDLTVEVNPTAAGCEECLRQGMRWVHLRLCLTCGHVGCCDSSRGRHATAHFWATEHPVVRSLEHGEDWRWCYVDEVPT
jgi:EmrB/QacA subfamily drug resistance transporter